MRVKFTIAICALLVLGLAVSEVAAQGYKIAVSKRAVVAGGHNQEIGKIRLTHRTQSQGDYNIREGANIEITFGGLSLTETTAGSETTNHPRIEGDATSPSAANDSKTKAGKIKFTLATGADAVGDVITISNVRLDVSGLADGAEVMATVNSAAAASDDQFDDITSVPSGSTATFKVSDVMDGLNVTAVGQVSVLNCDKGVTTGRMPSITVEEGFATAWETNAAAFAADAESAVSNTTHIRIVVANVPTGVSFRWPGDNRPKWNPASTSEDVPATTGDNVANPLFMKDPDHMAARGTGDAKTVVASLDFVSDGDTVGDDKTKRFAIYKFEGSDDGGELKDHDDFKNSFKISPRVTVDTSKTGMGGVADVWAQLWPAAKTGDNDDRGTKLTYTHAVETKDEGYFVNVTECVTYLLYPFLTCGAQADWTTGIAVANTSKDDEAFPVNSGATAQGGSVMVHAYPKSTYAEKMAAGNMMSSPDKLADPISATISGNLAAGDTVAITCNAHAGLAGFEGYAIVRAAFRHAHGMAFVLGNFQDGAAIDVAHGYIALVIPDPEFGADGPQGRGADDGESLGH